MILGQGTGNSCREDMTDNTDLPDGTPGLEEVDRSEDECLAHFSEPSYFFYGPLPDSSAPSPSQMSCPPFSGNSHNPHWIRSIKVLISVLDRNFLAFYHQNSRHTKNT